MNQTDEDELFKTLTHQIRRDIIKILGESELTFTQIKNQLGSIDSPTLSYHLKNLNPLITQVANKYKLSEIGEAALNLLSKTDQSVRIKRYQKKFLYAYIITVFCWILASTLIPIVLLSFNCIESNYLIQIIIASLSGTNFSIVWRLRKSY